MAWTPHGKAYGASRVVLARLDFTLSPGEFVGRKARLHKAFRRAQANFTRRAVALVNTRQGKQQLSDFY
jgi:hypothetical protein